MLLNKIKVATSKQCGSKEIPWRIIKNYIWSTTGKELKLVIKVVSSKALHRKQLSGTKHVIMIMHVRHTRLYSSTCLQQRNIILLQT